MAASLALAAAASFYAFSLRTELGALRASVASGSQEAARLRQEVVTLRREYVNLSRALTVLKAPDMRRADLKGQAPAPGATGRAFWSQAAGLLFAADRLPAL